MADFFGQVPCWPGPSKYQEVAQNLGHFLSTQAGVTMGIHGLQTDLTTICSEVCCAGNTLFPRWTTGAARSGHSWTAGQQAKLEVGPNWALLMKRPFPRQAGGESQ